MNNTRNSGRFGPAPRRRAGGRSAPPAGRHRSAAESIGAYPTAACATPERRPVADNVAKPALLENLDDHLPDRRLVVDHQHRAADRPVARPRLGRGRRRFVRRGGFVARQIDADRGAEPDMAAGCEPRRRICRANPYVIDRPRPVPRPIGLVVKNGSKARATISGAMPTPVSVDFATADVVARCGKSCDWVRRCVDLDIASRRSSGGRRRASRRGR